MRGTRPCLAMAVLFASLSTQAAHDIPVSADQIQHLGITLVKVSPAQTLMTDRVPAQVVIPPQQERVVSSAQAGLVESLKVTPGDQVSEGDSLAVIASPELVALQRDFLQAASNLRLAQADLKRDEQLVKEGIIAERRYLETRGRYEQTLAIMDERRQALLLAGLEEEAIQALADTRRLSAALEVRAPIAGAVLEQMVTVGQRVERAAPLYRIAQLEPLWLAIRVPLDRLGGLKPGAEVSLACTDAVAVITLIGHDVDPGNQTVLVRAVVRGAVGCLRPGQFTEVRISLLGADKQWRVPGSALTRSGAASYVFIRTIEGFRPVEAEVIGQEAGFAIVRAQLRGEEQVAASGLAAIKAIWLGTE